MRIITCTIAKSPDGKDRTIEQAFDFVLVRAEIGMIAGEVAGIIITGDGKDASGGVAVALNSTEARRLATNLARCATISLSEAGLTL